MEKDSKTTVAVERTTFAKLDRLAKANSVSKMEYIRHSCISPWQYNHVIQRLWTL
nr:unnamed protein product [uncultured bacterium]